MTLQFRYDCLNFETNNNKKYLKNDVTNIITFSDLLRLQVFCYSLRLTKQN